MIPDSVTNIENNAFNNCNSLSLMTLPTALEIIGGYAFRNTNISHIIFPNTIKILNNNCFNGCQNLSSVIFPKDAQISTIESSTFSNCINLCSVELCDQIEQIDHNAFSNCVELKIINFPENLKKIGERAFYSCSKLKSLEFRKDIDIECNAFSKCESLETIIIPFKTNMNAFLECNKLKNICFIISKKYRHMNVKKLRKLLYPKTKKFKIKNINVTFDIDLSDIEYIMTVLSKTDLNNQIDDFENVSVDILKYL
jgi:hypothetical protein